MTSMEVPTSTKALQTLTAVTTKTKRKAMALLQTAQKEPTTR